eukprot:550092_1
MRCRPNIFLELCINCVYPVCFGLHDIGESIENEHTQNAKIMQLLDARRFAVRRFKSNHVYFPLIAFHKAFTKANHPLNIIASQNMSRFPKDPRKQPTSSFVFRTSASKTAVRDRSNTDPRTRRQ